MKKIFFLLFWVFACIYSFSQQNDSVIVKYAQTIKAEDLSKHLHILASDEYEGRETGKKGQKMAAEYIKNHFEKIKIKPAVNGSYYQEYPLVIQFPHGAEIEIKNTRYGFMKDFYYFRGFNDMSLQAKEFTFMGYGIDDSMYSDFKKEDVTGKLVLIFSGEPYDIFENSILTGTPEPSHWSSNWRKKLELMKKKGAAAVFIITEDVPAEIKMLKHYIETPSMYLDDANEEKEERTAPSFYISEKMALKILNISPEKLKKMKEKIDKKAKPLSFTSKTDVKIRLQRKTDNLTAENVLGLIEGTDLKDEYIIITAHYDHIGADGKEVYNGADDDGSGTVALLEIAEAFMKAKSEGNGPRRSVLIMPVSGEEKGLLGSKYYTDHPVFPLEKTVCDLNIDMIGRLDDKHKDNPNYVYLIGSDKLSSELHKISEEANDKYSNLQLDYTFNRPEDPNRFYYRSDHYNFAKNNIPVIFYFNGTHEDYHKPTDTVDKINFEKMEKITRLVFYTAWELANRNERIKVDAKNDFK